MNLALEKRERVTTSGKGRGEIRSEIIVKVNGMVADMPIADRQGRRYGAFEGWGMATGKVEVLLVIVDRSAEA